MTEDPYPSETPELVGMLYNRFFREIGEGHFTDATNTLATLLPLVEEARPGEDWPAQLSTKLGLAIDDTVLDMFPLHPLSFIDNGGTPDPLGALLAHKGIHPAQGKGKESKDDFIDPIVQEKLKELWAETEEWYRTRTGGDLLYDPDYETNKSAYGRALFMGELLRELGPSKYIEFLNKSLKTPSVSVNDLLMKYIGEDPELKAKMMGALFLKEKVSLKGHK